MCKEENLFLKTAKTIAFSYLQRYKHEQIWKQVNSIIAHQSSTTFKLPFVSFFSPSQLAKKERKKRKKKKIKKNDYKLLYRLQTEAATNNLMYILPHLNFSSNENDEMELQLSTRIR